MKNFLFFLLTLLSSTFFGNAFAQSNPLYIDQYPKQLKAEEDVFFTLKASDDFNLSELNIIWKIDSSVMDQGIGRTTFKTKTPKQNVEKTVTATIEIPGQSSVFISAPLRASPFVLLYEGEKSVTPAFYKGRKLPGREGSVRIGVLTPGTDYSTDFTVNSSKTTSTNNIITSQSRITENKMEVSARIIQKGEEVAYLSKTINLVKPEILLFRENKATSLQTPVSGTESGTESGTDVYINAEPFFFYGNNKYDSELGYIWRLNDIVQNVTEPWFVKLSSKNKEQVQAKLEIKQTEKITQQAEKLFNLDFQ
jgi:hypothetical protein